MDHLSAVKIRSLYREDAPHVGLIQLAFDGARPYRIPLDMNHNSAISARRITNFYMEHKVVIYITSSNVPVRCPGGHQKSVTYGESRLLLNRTLKKLVDLSSLTLKHDDKLAKGLAVKQAGPPFVIAQVRVSHISRTLRGKHAG